ncbi:AhpC/TSA family protein [Prochlorococcus marinus]|uniref:AhpC/TSA family protein n=1 Tax=Prochlorococcus marinus TaxID=1219 RepID=UPI0022B30A70|nr:AhpC/TSA family protein [Prochlorococcus marinus]
MVEAHDRQSDFVILKTKLNKLMNYKNVIDEFFGKEVIFLDQRKNLIVLLGSFADFDSFEYSQQLSAYSKKLFTNSVELILIGIGSEKSKELFCKFNNIDSRNVIAVGNADLHKKLNLNEGFVSQMPSIINLLAMCAGISSRGTIKEVLRGYFGDKNAKSLFAFDENINIGPYFLFKGKMFDIFSKKQTLRPFELATRRLMNMIEILSNWNTYVPDSKFLTQRGATIILNEKGEVLYEYISESLLGYSNKMSAPLSFLDDALN